MDEEKRDKEREKKPERPHDHADPGIWQYSTSDYRKCKVCGLEQVRTCTNGPFRDSLSNGPFRDIPEEEAEPEGVPMPEQPEEERRRIRFMEFHVTIWRLFKTDQKPKVGMVIAVDNVEHAAKITDIKIVGNKYRVYYDIIAPPALPDMRCPWCNEYMDYNGSVMGEPESVSFTCKTCIVEVTVHEPTEDRDIADFLEMFYPQ